MGPTISTPPLPHGPDNLLPLSPPLALGTAAARGKTRRQRHSERSASREPRHGHQRSSGAGHERGWLHPLKTGGHARPTSISSAPSRFRPCAAEELAEVVAQGARSFATGLSSLPSAQVSSAGMRGSRWNGAEQGRMGVRGRAAAGMSRGGADRWSGGGAGPHGGRGQAAAVMSRGGAGSHGGGSGPRRYGGAGGAGSRPASLLGRLG
uniref:Uncharacterized protein n=1 Tax=Setaria italica TaxID=4555 RepID=K3XZD6_SETIT